MKRPMVGHAAATARSLWEGWKRVGRKIGDIQARAILMLFYFVVLAPFALVVRWGADPLAIKPGARRGWQPRETDDGAPKDRATQQF